MYDQRVTWFRQSPKRGTIDLFEQMVEVCKVSHFQNPIEAFDALHDCGIWYHLDAGTLLERRICLISYWYVHREMYPYFFNESYWRVEVEQGEAILVKVNR